MSASTPRIALACSGGIAFDWAVAHQRGGIVQAVVESKFPVQDGVDEIVVTDATAVRGDPILPFSLTAVAGLPCDQVADRGETILILYDIRGAQPPITFPTYYVISGPDALRAAVLRDGLGLTAPATDTDSSMSSSQASVDWASVAILASAFAVGAALTIRRTRPRQAER